MSGNKTGNRRAAFAERDHDFYPTPAIAVQALMRVVELPRTIWEPCCGDGAIVKVLREAGHTVIAQDLVDWGCPDSRTGIDFLTVMAPPSGFDTILTNPPYKYAQEFITKALALVPRVIMLLRIAFIESESRRQLFEAGFAGYYPFRNRLPMMHRHDFQGKRNESSAMGYAWFEFNRNHRGAAKIRHLGFSKCKVCKQPFTANEGALTCSNACRQKLYRQRKEARYRKGRNGAKSVTRLEAAI